MVSTVDKLLLSADQQAALEKFTRAYDAAKAIGDEKGMNAAHQGAEQIRAAAGYSGGGSGDRYQLLKSANAPAGYNGYETIVNNYANQAMHTIAAGYADQMAALDQQRAEIHAQGEKDQASARSAAWNTQRLAADGLLTRGLDNTGIADVIAATALNQAAANAYQALLKQQQDLNTNAAAQSSARSEALEKAATLQDSIGTRLSDAYQSFYDNNAERSQEVLLKQMGIDSEKTLKQMGITSDQILKQMGINADVLLKQMGIDADLGIAKMNNDTDLDIAKMNNDTDLDITKMNNNSAQKVQAMKNQGNAQSQKNDYYYTLALQQLKRQWELEDQAKKK